MLRVVLILAGGIVGLATWASSQAVWQADLQIRGLSVSETKGGLRVRVVVASEFGEAMAARVEIMLPVGVGVTELSPGCVAGPNPPGVRALRARVVCRLGDLPSRSSREVQVATTAPPSNFARGFGAVALSDTPDPRPGNNFAEKTLPPVTP